MKYLYFLIPCLFLLPVYSSPCQTQGVYDDFEGNGSIESWTADACQINTAFLNPVPGGLNPSQRVLRYQDAGGQFANVRFDVPSQFRLGEFPTFRLKIYIPSAGLTGNQPNQVSLKLQNGTLPEPWITQCEIIKPAVLNQWQEISFNFALDSWVNLDPASAPPLQRTDFNRVLIQVNGENNSSQVLAYIDDFIYTGTIPEDPVYQQLVWSDEFDGSGAVDGTRWFHQTKLPAGGSWFNGELQHYTNRLENATVLNGILKINARRESFSDQGITKQFTSARLNSKFAFTGGRVEMRARLPSGAGTWPAFWMVGKNINEVGAYWQTQGYGSVSWPACGEIDILEHWGSNSGFVQSAMHTPSSFGNTVNKGGRMFPAALDGFHVYRLDWYPTRMVFSVDGVVHYVYNPSEKNPETWPFTSDQYLLLNLAIEPTITPAFTQAALEVDYVRVYQGTTTRVKPGILKEPFKVVPNPFSGRLRLELTEELEEEVLIELYGEDGRLVLHQRKSVNGKIIELENLQNLQSGFYNGKLVRKAGQTTFRLLKE